MGARASLARASEREPALTRRACASSRPSAWREAEQTPQIAPSDPDLFPWEYDVSMAGIPRVLLSQSGWRIDYADEHSAQDGKLGLCSPGAESSSSASEPAAEISWRPGALSSWIDDRRASAGRSTTMPVVGATAHVFYNLGPHEALQTIVALWQLDDHVFEFRARVVDLDEFTVLVDSLRCVEESEWLSALPVDVVRLQTTRQRSPQCCMA